MMNTDVSVIDINSPYPLSAQQVASFGDNGFIKLKGVLSAAKIAHCGPEITRQTIALNTESRPLEERSTYDRAFLQVMNLWEHSTLVREFVLGKRLGRIAATGRSGVRGRCLGRSSARRATRWSIRADRS